MRILCTNDDGYLALGIRVLASAARTLGSVTIVAPDREQSATSNSLTLHHPLRVRRTTDGDLVVDGTPTDCVILAVNELMDERPDICFSGINHGSNMGEDVLYSGTVAGAMEATVIGIPAIAVSYAGEAFEDLDAWEDVVASVLRGIIEQDDFPADTLFNINLPPIDPAQAALELPPRSLAMLTESKRIRTTRLSQELGVRLKHPTYREGLGSIHAKEWC